MQIYKHAFGAMRGSREMWAIVLGFGGIPIIGFGAPAIARLLGLW